MTENALSILIIIFSVELQQTEISVRKLFLFQHGCQDDAFWYITRSYERLCLGIGTKQERIIFWKWEIQLLMFQIYFRVHH